MKIYYTGQPLRNADYLALMRGRHVMFSYLSRRRSVWDDLTPFAGAVLDSGAYSVWRRGASVDIGQYADYCAEREDEFDWYANLDSITDWKKTLKNQAELERRGLSPVPVFHLGEPWALLDDLVYSYERVAIGRGQNIPFALLVSMLEFVFDRYSAKNRNDVSRRDAEARRRHCAERNYLTQSRSGSGPRSQRNGETHRNPTAGAPEEEWTGRAGTHSPLPLGEGSGVRENAWATGAMPPCGAAPLVKFHGFRMTDRRLIARFPFDSVDSTTWNAGVAYGELPTDHGRASGFSYLTDTTRARVWLDFFTAAPKAHAFTHRKRIGNQKTLLTSRGAQNAL